MMAPVVESLSAHRSDLVVAKVDVDEAPALAARYGVSVIPTLIVFRGGQPVSRSSGYSDEEDLIAQLGL